MSIGMPPVTISEREAECRDAGSKTGRLVLIAALAAIFLAIGPNPVSPANSDPLAALIARARAALGPGVNRVRSIYVAGTVELGGISGSFQSWSDRSNGRYSMITDLGPLSSADGYDGTAQWWRDSKGIVFPQRGRASREWRATGIFFRTDALFKPDYGGATLSYLGTRTDSGRTYQAIEVRVPNGEPKHWYTVEEWYDTESALLTRRTTSTGGRNTITDFSDYQSVNGLMMAHDIQVSSDSAPTEIVKVTQARADVPDLEAHLRCPPSVANDFSLPGGQTTIPFKFVDHQIVVEVYINGQGPFNFYFDSGGSNLMDPTVAWNVGARSIVTLPQRGIGEHTLVAQYDKIDQLSIGGATLRDQYLAVAQIERPFPVLIQGMTFHPRAQGLIGREVLARFVTTIDYAGGKITLRVPTTAAPSAQPAAAAPSAIPLQFDGSNAEFACRINGVSGTCMVDTGSGWSVTVTSPFARKHPDVLPHSINVSGYWGAELAGPSRGVGGPLSSFQMGSITLTNLDAQFSYDNKGMLADRYLAAIVGNKVWSQFKLTLDYPHATMVLARNPAVD